MTDERPEGRETRDPAVERAVAGLLRDARETGPVPSEVAARIDEALAREAAGGPAGDPSSDPSSDPAGAPQAATPGARLAPVVGLRRRTRRVVLAVGAAAAALVVAVPVAQELVGSGGADSSSTAGAGASGGAESAQPDVGGEAGAQSDEEPEGGDRGLVRPGNEEAAPGAAALLLGADDYDAQVAAFVRAGAAGPPATASCGAPVRPGVRLVAVRLDGVLGALALRANRGEVVTELYLCGGPGPERRLVVPLEESDG